MHPKCTVSSIPLSIMFDVVFIYNYTYYIILIKILYVKSLQMLWIVSLPCSLIICGLVGCHCLWRSFASIWWICLNHMGFGSVCVHLVPPRLCWFASSRAYSQVGVLPSCIGTPQPHVRVFVFKTILSSHIYDRPTSLRHVWGSTWWFVYKHWVW